MKILDNIQNHQKLIRSITITFNLVFIRLILSYNRSRSYILNIKNEKLLKITFKFGRCQNDKLKKTILNFMII